MITKDLRVEKRLCVHCGACGEVCPSGAIELFRDNLGQLTTDIMQDKCLRCGLCQTVCPSEAFDHAKHAREIGGQGLGALLLPVEGCWKAFSNDKMACFKASSGGVTRALAEFCLETGKVDAVVALAEDPNDGLKPTFKMFKDVRFLEQLANSKYYPVSLEGVIRAIIRDSGSGRVLFIGLPCHIRAVRKAFRSIPQLQGRSLIASGLFCKKTKDGRYARYLAARLGFGKGPYRTFQFRGEGWPGTVKVEASGREGRRPLISPGIGLFPWRWHLFSPCACLFCYDVFARDADVSVGDPWLKDYLTSEACHRGISFVVAHTKRGRDLVEGCPSIIKETVGPEEVLRSQSLAALSSKLLCAPARLQVLLNTRGAEAGFAQRMNARWFLGWKKLFEGIFSHPFCAKLPDIIFKILNQFPQAVFPVSNKMGKDK